ncbi:FtsX-like permease family protein [Demequina aurantiaca]|uniref:FtsX-like permease family protein n=1 Tax=Demequina aurantiaca TaxID=676200 RepID=UPI003D334C3F
MKWAAFVTIGIATTLVALVAGPLWAAPVDSNNPLIPPFYDLLFLAIYLVPWFFIAGLIALLFLRLDLAGKRQGIATRMALGEQRSTILRKATREGIRFGVIAAGSGVAVGLISSQVLAGEGLQGGEGKLSVSALLSSLLVFVVAVATAALVSLLAIAAVTRGTPDQVDAAALGARVIATNPSRKRVVAERVGWITYAIAFVLATINRLVPLDNWALLNLSEPGWLMVLKNLALTIALVGTLWMIFLVSKRLVVRAVRWAAELLEAGNSRGGRSIAADGLARPSDSRVLTLSVCAIVSLIVAVSVAGAGHAQSLSSAGAAANPEAFLFSIDVGEGVAQPPGFTQVSLDADALAALVADPRVAVVPISLFYSDPLDVAYLGPDRSTHDSPQNLTLATDITASDAVAPNALRTLGMTGGVVVDGQDALLDAYDGAGGYGGVSALSVEGQGTSVYRIGAPLQFTAMDRSWATEIWGDAPISAAGLFLADGLPAQPSAMDIAREYFPEGTAWGYVGGTYGWGTTYVGISFVLVAMTIAVVLIVSATLTSVRLRRKDIATFAALGASPSALRAAPVWEASALAASSFVTGSAVGVAVSIVATNTFLLKPGAPIQASEILWHAWSDLIAVPWGSLVLAGVATTVVAALVAAVFAASMVGNTPVEELRAADKEGVR